MQATIAPNCHPAFIPAACDLDVSLDDRRHGWRERVRGGCAVASSAALIAAFIAIAGILSSSPSRQHTLSSLGEKYLIDYSLLNNIPCRADCGDEGAQNGKKDYTVKVNGWRSTSRTLSQGKMEKQHLKNHSEHISLYKEESAEADWYQRHLPSLAMDGANSYDIDCFYHHEVSQYC